MADAKAMRRYQAGIERALALFDATNEWADYIAFLSRLLKALQNPPEHADIPLKSTVARYLAQCLRPSLPSGVHQKALEVYDLIFSIIGPRVLGQDLSLYLTGLSHTLSFASLSTRPQFLAIYDDYILALPAAILRPAVRALVMSLLPGIEEETSEDFERTLSTFNRLRAKFVEDKHEEIFWQNLFLASITSSNRRPGVLVYLVRYLPKLPSQSKLQQNDGGIAADGAIIKTVVTPEPGLLVRCFATGLQDQQPLVQRGFLDLLVSHLPLDATIFANNAHASDLDVLVDASAAVVLKRDMGLNRRLWAWYTGAEVRPPAVVDADTMEAPMSPIAAKGDAQGAAYFSTYGLASLIRSISSMLNQPSQEPGHRARPFRIALSLMDRWEIGGPVVESQFVPLLESLQLYQASAPSQEAFDEVYRSANVFFDGIESRLIASQLLALLDKGRLDLVLFIVSDFNLEEEDMMKNHVPSMCLFIVQSLQEYMADRDCSQPQKLMTIEDKLGQVLQNLLLLVPAGVLRDIKEPEGDYSRLKGQILFHYSSKSAKLNGVASRHTIPNDVIGSALIEGLFECLQHCISSENAQDILMGHMFACLDQCIALVQSTQTLERIRFLPCLLQTIQALERTSKSKQYQILTGIARLTTTLKSRDSQETVLTPQALCTLVPQLIGQLWHLLLSSIPQYHVEAVECIWQLHAISRSLRLAESQLLSLLITEFSQQNQREHCMQRFGTLWVHSRLAAKQLQGLKIEQPGLGDDVLDLLQYPLLQIIDLAESKSKTHPCSVWMSSLTSLNTLFGIVFLQMPKDMTDSSSMAIALQRLGKLISIAKGNDAQWKSFSGKTGHRDAVFELCSSLTSNQAVVNSLGVEALQIVQLLIGNEGMEFGEDILKMLSTRLVASNQLEDFQNSLLDTLQLAFSASQPPSQPDWLVPILLDGISNTAIDINLDKWITLLCTIIPLLGASILFSNLLKITSCMCKRIELYFKTLQESFTVENQAGITLTESPKQSANHPERSISSLLSGMEYVLARAHHQASLPRNEQEAGVNGSIVDLPTSRSFANDHLTVVLCMQDALKVCSRLWMWRSAGKATITAVDTKSLHFMTSRLRARSRRILENLVEAEPQESLETLMGLWVEKRMQSPQHHQVLELLQTLDGARPKFMMPATFNAIYNRTNPNALDQSQRSSLSVNVNAFELIAFLNDYTSALEDDLLDEIWTDCTAFLKEILANPMPHRSILLRLLEFTSVLCRKMENTNFGEETRMRRELADLCTRLFTAIFTIKPQGLDGSESKATDILSVFDKKRSFTRSSVQPSNALQIMQDTLPDLSLILAQSDRLATVYTGIATNVTGPILHSRLYPQNVSPELLALLQTMSTAPAATKAWKKDVTDAFNDAKFFQNPTHLIELGWLPLLRQVALSDKALMNELLSRLTPPAAAGLMFGVGASAARTEADKKTQATLRRIALLCLSVEIDHFVPNLQPLIVKLEELLTATPESSPSSNSKTDVYLMLRTILLTFSHTQLSAFWPLIDNELRELCRALISKDFGRFTLSAQLQGAKLLDVLLLMKPDEFQLHEWLFVTDTMDAIYPPSGLASVALADQINLKSSSGHIDVHPSYPDVSRKPSLCVEQSRDEQNTDALLAAFFSQLSIRTFEDSYNLRQIDFKACREDLLKDLFVEQG